MVIRDGQGESVPWIKGPKNQHQVQIHNENPGTFQYKSGNMSNKSRKTSIRPDKNGGYKNKYKLHSNRRKINSRTNQSDTARSSGSSTSGFRRLTSTLNAGAGAIGVSRNSYPQTYCVRPRLFRFRKIII